MVCNSEYNSEYYQKNKERISEYYQKNKEQKIKYSKERYNNKKEEILKKSKIKYKENKEKRKIYQKERYNNKKKEINKKSREYNQKNKVKINEYLKKYQKEKRKLNSTFALNETMSASIYYALKKNKAGRKWESLVGYTKYDLKKHLELQFTDGMEWDNYGSVWHIDHRIPKSWFKFIDAEDQAFKDCWALENLKPMFAPDNISKNNNFAEPTKKQDKNKYIYK